MMKYALCLSLCALPFFAFNDCVASDDVEIWRQSTAGYEVARTIYLEEIGPSKLMVSCLQRFEGKNAPKSVDEVTSRRRAVITAIRHGYLRRYERREEATPDITVDDPEWKVDKHFLQTRTPTEFRYWDKLEGTASVWSEFRWDPRTVLDEITPPVTDEGTLAPREDNEHVWEFRSEEGKRLDRYHLDPQQGMMPVMIETFQVSEPLFLNRIIEIRGFKKQGTTFFPVEAVYYHNIGGQRGQWDSKSVHHLKSVQTEVVFDPKDYSPEFAPDVRVRDRRNQADKL